MSVETAFVAAEAVIIAYFVAINLVYLTLNVLAFVLLRRHVAEHSLTDMPRFHGGFDLPISVLMPAYNEESTIVSSVRSMLHMEYPQLEVIVVNDGSRDRTLEVLTQAFDLKQAAFDYRSDVPCAPLRGFYRSAAHPNLLVIDKENGGKADALNAGINAATHPLFCGVDADGVLERGSLRRIVEPFVADPTTIAVGGTVSVVNGCVVRDGFVESVDLPKRMLPLLQTVEYLRAFLFGRFGWSALNAVLIVAGAFGLFRRESVVAVGGYRKDTIGEDMELVMRLHMWHRLKGVPYRITFVPDPICWTEVPESLSVLRNQRVRWQRGLGQSLMLNWRLLFHRRGGAPGWVAFPVMVLFEWLGPVLELAGYVLMTLGWAQGLLTGTGFVAFLILAIGIGMLLSVNALLLEEMAFQMYGRPRHLVRLIGAAIWENLGYRQLNGLWRIRGLFESLFGIDRAWGEMKRTATWQRDH